MTGHPKLLVLLLRPEVAEDEEPLSNLFLDDSHQFVLVLNSSAMANKCNNSSCLLLDLLLSLVSIYFFGRFLKVT